MNMKKAILSTLAVGVLLAVFSAPAIAADSGWYVAGDVGRSQFSGGFFDNNYQLPSSWVRSTSDRSTGYRLTGGYQFTQNWGVEAGYVDLGHGTVTDRNPHPDPFLPDVATRTTYRIGAKGFFAAGTATWPIGEQWSVFARVGVVDGRLDFQPHTNGNINLMGGSDTSWKATYGVGAKWKFQPEWSLRLGWDSYHQIGSQYDLSMISLGVEWRFF